MEGDTVEFVVDRFPAEGSVLDISGKLEAQPAIADTQAEDETATLHENAMLNHHVLSKLFEVCPLSDLKNFRLVSTLWYELTLPRFRGEVTARINGSYNRGGRLTCCPEKIRGLHWLNIQEFLTTGTILEKGPPFQCLRIEECYISDVSRQTPLALGNIGQDTPSPQRMETSVLVPYNMVTIFDQCGKWLRKLVIEKVVSHECELLKILFQKLKNLENLALLEILEHTGRQWQYTNPQRPLIRSKLKCLRIGGTSKYPSDVKFPFTWVQLFSVFTGLETVHFQNLTTAWLKELAEALSQSHIHNRIHTLTLTNFLCPSGLPEEVNELLELPQLSLKRLKIDLSKDKLRTVLPRIIRRHGLDLEMLHVDRSNIQQFANRITYDNFPFGTHLVKLTELVFRGPVVADLHFLKQTPNLKTLRMETFQIPEILSRTTRLTEMKGILLEHLWSFEINLLYCIEKHEMEMIVGCMPNVTRFQGMLNNESFRVLCGNWKELVELSIGSSYVTWEGIVGTVNRSGIIVPNISDLTCLQKFSMHLDEIGLTELNGSRLRDILKDVVRKKSCFPQLQTTTVAEQNIRQRATANHVIPVQRDPVREIDTANHVIPVQLEPVREIDTANHVIPVQLYPVLEIEIETLPNSVKKPTIVRRIWQGILQKLDKTKSSVSVLTCDE